MACRGFYLTTPSKSVTYVLNLLCIRSPEPAPLFSLLVAPSCRAEALCKGGLAKEDQRFSFETRSYPRHPATAGSLIPFAPFSFSLRSQPRNILRLGRLDEGGYLELERRVSG
jgi:hypothetical protein